MGLASRISDFEFALVNLLFGDIYTTGHLPGSGTFLLTLPYLACHA